MWLRGPSYLRQSDPQIRQSALVRHEEPASQPPSRPANQPARPPPPQSTFSPYLPSRSGEPSPSINAHSIPFRNSRAGGKGVTGEGGGRRGKKGALHRLAALAYQLGRWHSMLQGH